MTTNSIHEVAPGNSASQSIAKTWLRAIELTSRTEADPHRLFADIVDDWANKQPQLLALISESESFSYRLLADRINRYARWALSAGIKPGDKVCLIMPTRPDYVAAWLGISRVGGVVALINTNLVGQSLAHCINIAGADHIIIAHEYPGDVRTIAFAPQARRKAMVRRRRRAH